MARNLCQLLGNCTFNELVLLLARTMGGRMCADILFYCTGRHLGKEQTVVVLARGEIFLQQKAVISAKQYRLGI